MKHRPFQALKLREWWQDRKFLGQIREAIIEAGGLRISGEQKHIYAAKKAATIWLDEHIEPSDPILEYGSDLLIWVAMRMVSAVVEREYQKAAKKGLVQ